MRRGVTRSNILITSTYLQWEPRRYPTENLEASGTAGKLRLSKLYCSERREVSDRFSWDIAEANRIRRSRCGNSEATQYYVLAIWQHIDVVLC